MNSIELKVTKSTMSVSNIYTLNQGEYNVDKCVFDFSDDYNDLIKKAVFIYNEEDPIEMVILDNECNIPYELLQVATEFTLKVYAYEVKNNELVQRYSPTPLKIFLREGSYQGSNEVITPSQFEQYEAKLDEGLDDVADALDDVNTALQTMATATEETNRLNIDVSDKVNKDVTITLTKKDNTTKSVVISDGDDFQYNWDGTRLGVKTDKEQEYQYVDLQGQQGPMGPQGEAFQIKKTYTTTQQMVADYDNMSVNDYVMISGNIEQQDNATLWVKTEVEDPTYKWVYLADFSGATGIQGPTGATPNIQIGNVTQGDTPNVTRRGTDENPILDFTLVKGDKGNTGNTGPTGNGILSVEKISTSGLVDTYRQTFTNGEHFDYDVTNGADGNVTDVQIDGESIVDNGVANIEGYNELLSENSYLQTITQGLYNALPKATTTGESGTLNNTCENAPLKIGLGSNTEQETTTGKNLLRYTLPVLKSVNTDGTWSGNVYTLNGLTFTVLGDLSIKVNGTATGETYTRFGLFQNVLSFDANTQIFMSGCPANGSSSTYRLRLNVTGDEDTGSGKSINRSSAWSSGIFIQVETGTQCSAILFKPQIELGSSATSYEMPIGVTPSPDYPQEINVVSGSNKIISTGKNFLPSFDSGEWELYNGATISNGVLSLPNSNSSAIIIMPWDKSLYVYESFEMASGTAAYTSINMYDENMQLIDTYGRAMSNLNVGDRVEVDWRGRGANFSTTSFLRFVFQRHNTYAPNEFSIKFAQISKNSNDPYEPFGKVYPINLPVKNILPINQITSQTSNELTITNLGDGTIKLNGTTNATTRLDVMYTQPLKANTSYIFTNFNVRSVTGANINIYDSNDTILSSILLSNSTKVYTPTDDITVVKMGLYIDSGQTFSNYIVKVQLEEGSKTNSFTPYGTTPIELCKNGSYKDEFVKGTGKNLLNNTLITTETTSENIKATPNGDGSITLSGTATGTAYFNLSQQDFGNVGIDSSLPTQNDNYIATLGVSITGLKMAYSEINGYTFIRVASGTTLNTRVYPMIRRTGTDETFEPYGTKDKWLLKKNIGKLVLDGSESWNKSGTTSFDRFLIERSIGGIVTEGGYCNYFKVSTVSIPTNLYELSNNGNSQVVINYSTYGTTTTEQFKTWLSTHNTNFYYALLTPYCISIPTSLQNQLNAIEKALAKDGQTNVSQINNDIPFILDLETITKVSQGNSL